MANNRNHRHSQNPGLHGSVWTAEFDVALDAAKESGAVVLKQVRRNDHHARNAFYEGDRFTRDGCMAQPHMHLLILSACLDETFSRTHSSMRSIE